MSRVGSRLLVAVAIASAIAPVAADAQPGQRDHGRHARAYDGRYGYAPPPPGYDDRDYRRDYRARGRCDKGTGGTILGAIAGGLLGDSVAGRGDRMAGALIGAGAGALAGRAIDRDC